MNSGLHNSPTDNDAIRLAIEAGWQSAQRGELIDAEVVFARIENELASLSARNQAISITSNSASRKR